jgi:hypothetical protein
MACDTFIKISQKCKRHFVVLQVGEVMPFIEEILNNISAIICDLQPQQVHTFYEAVGYMINAQTDGMARERLIEKYMSLPNQIWDGVIAAATKARITGYVRTIPVHIKALVLCVECGGFKRSRDCETAVQYTEDKCAGMQSYWSPICCATGPDLSRHVECVQSS